TALGPDRNRLARQRLGPRGVSAPREEFREHWPPVGLLGATGARLLADPDKPVRFVVPSLRVQRLRELRRVLCEEGLLAHLPQLVVARSQLGLRTDRIASQRLDQRGHVATVREEIRQAELGQDRARLRDARPRLAEPAAHALEAGESDVAVRLDEAVAVCALEDLLAAADPLLHGQRPPQRGRGEPAQDPSLLAGIAGTTGVHEPAL